MWREYRIATLISRYVNRITNKRKIPEEMTTEYISSIFKKGDRKEWVSYRRIRGTKSIMKILSRATRNDLDKQFKSCEEEQCGLLQEDLVFTIFLP